MSLPGMSPFDALLPEWWSLAYASAACALPLLVLVAACIRVSGERRRQTIRTPLPPAQVPAEFRRHGQPWIGRLGFLGFSVQGCARVEDARPGESHEWQLVHAGEQTLALVEGHAATPGKDPVFSLRLLSFLSDGRVLLTAGQRPGRLPSHWILTPCGELETLEAQIAAHRTALEAAKGDAAALLPAPQALAARLATEDHALLDALLASGDFRPSGGESNDLRAAPSRIPALAFHRIVAAAARGFRPARRPRDISGVAKSRMDEEKDAAFDEGSSSLSLEQLVERDIRRFRELTTSKRGAKHLFLKLGVLVATCALCIVLFGEDRIPETLGALLAIITLHEFGHWLAMKAFGFTGMGKFFIPLLGPVDLGQKPHAPAWQQLVVILAGPVPGILAGLAMVVAGFFMPEPPSRLLDAAGLAILYNGFHLLPFLPLDGGKVVDLLLFRDLPVIRPVFTAFSALAALVASFLLKSRAVRYIAIGMFAGLIWDIKMIRVVRGGRRLGWAGRTDDPEEALRRIFTGIRQEKNDAFMRSSDWARQIDVLLAEVLRKRAGIATRLFGGAFYACVCLLPLVLVSAALVLFAAGGIGQLMGHAAASAEYSAAFPLKPDSLDVEKHDRLEQLAASTLAAIGTEEEEYAFGVPAAAEREALAGKAAASPETASALDKLDWASAGIASHHYAVDERMLSIWLEVLCGKMESAAKEVRHPEAARRAEVLLHAVAAMEPANTPALRGLLRDAELRTLGAIERTAASGKLDPATLQRIESRINLLNKAPVPEVENVLLLDGWAEKQAGGWLNAGSAPSGDRWKNIYASARGITAGMKSKGKESACLVLAAHWKQSRKVGEIPQALGDIDAPAPGEADYILAFCEDHRRIMWRRLTTLSALRLETYRQKAGKLPENWEHGLPGGAKLSLVRTQGPCLHLADSRTPAQKAPPAWLGEDAAPAAPVEHLCPLYGARFPELSRN